MKAHKIVILFVFVEMLFSCSKYLDKKPNSTLYVPDNWKDLQALLDLNAQFNFQSASALVEVIADDYYSFVEQWQEVSSDLRSAHIWDDKSTQFEDAWTLPYRCIYTSNVVLQELNKIKPNTPIDRYNNIQGTALFYRANSYYSLLQLYSKPYGATSTLDQGVVLKLSPEINESLSRASVSEVYNQVISDLIKSIELLPSKAENLMRPNKVSSMALLARIYLSMADYENAAKYSTLVLEERSTLLNFNELSPNDSPTLPPFLTNPEIIFFNSLQFNEMVSPVIVNIDSTLYNSYDNNDLRKKVFFGPSLLDIPNAYFFKGSYFESFPYGIFNGLTTDEIYLIIAESLVRNGRIDQGLSYLNTLLMKRYKSGTFSGYSISDQEEALKIILSERRKELVFRGIRWSDIKRYNAEGRHINLKRVLGGIEYVLPANDLRSIMLIPNIEIIRSGIVQNSR